MIELKLDKLEAIFLQMLLNIVMTSNDYSKKDKDMAELLSYKTQIAYKGYMYRVVATPIEKRTPLMMGERK